MLSLHHHTSFQLEESGLQFCKRTIFLQAASYEKLNISLFFSEIFELQFRRIINRQTPSTLRQTKHTSIIILRFHYSSIFIISMYQLHASHTSSDSLHRTHKMQLRYLSRTSDNLDIM